MERLPSSARLADAAAEERLTRAAAADDVEATIEPIADGRADYPPAFCEGLIEGLPLDQNGFIRTTAEDLQYAVGVAAGLTAARRTALFRGLSERLDDAQETPGLSLENLAAMISTIRELEIDRRNASTRPSLENIADRLGTIRDDID